MSELKVDTISPALATKVVVTPGVVVQDSVGTDQFEVTSSGEIKVLGPLRVGSHISNTPGVENQILTSQGEGLPPVWSYGAIPLGGIIIWYDSGNIPPGWALCDGQTVRGYKTPDLRDRFVVGAGRNYSANQRGGASGHAFTINNTNVPPHRHFMTISSPCDTPGFTNYGYNQLVTYLGDPHELEQKGSPDGTRTCYWHIKTGLPDTATGAPPTQINIPTTPPFYALAYIMRVPT